MLRAGLVPLVVGCHGSFHLLGVDVFSMAIDMATGEYVNGRTSWTIGKCEYKSTSERRDVRATAMSAVYSTAWADLKQYVEKGNVLVLPRMYSRKLKELTP